MTTHTASNHAGEAASAVESTDRQPSPILGIDAVTRERDFEALLDTVQMPAWADDYNRIHRRRFARTLLQLPELRGKTVLEVGTYGLMCTLLRKHFSPARVDVSFHSPTGPDKIEQRVFDWAGSDPFTSYNIELQNEAFPCSSAFYDVILCTEVIEHMPTDPMHLLVELNRIAKPGACMVLTTPNIASMSAVARILSGANPIGYCKFKRSRSSDRHNIEFTPDQIHTLLESAGWAPSRLWTENVWDMNPYTELHEQLRAAGGYEGDQALRGDNIFCVANKVSETRDRWPAALYD